jgi:hypothetical protein
LAFKFFEDRKLLANTLGEEDIDNSVHNFLAGPSFIRFESELLKKKNYEYFDEN